MTEPILMIDKTIKKIEYLYTCTGINIKAREKTLKDKYRSWAVYIVNCISLYTDLLGAWAWFFVGIAQSKTFTELTYMSPCMTMCTLSVVKMTFTVKNEPKIDDVLKNLRQLEIEQKERLGDKETDQIIETEHKELNRLIRVLHIFYLVLITCFALCPLMLVLMKYLKTNELELRLPFLVLYPFDPFDMKYFPWIYLKHVWGDILVVLGVCAVDFMFYIFCTYLRMQFRLLCHYIEIIIPKENSEILSNKEAIRMKLVGFIKWHQQLISCVYILENLYTVPTLFNFVASSMIICLTGFNVMAIDDKMFVFSFLCFLMMSLLQIYFLCSFGDLLMESSMAIGDAVYYSRWYLLDISLTKIMLIILIRAQAPCRLTACKFADVNLKAFMKICSTAWSYFALLQTLYSGPEE